MKLPYKRNVVINRNKLINYLLSQTHPTGKHKAKFFQEYGFNEINVDMLEKSLLNIIQSNNVITVESSQFGRKYLVDGLINTPSGNTINIRTVWIINAGERRPRFVTAYPV